MMNKNLNEKLFIASVIMMTSFLGLTLGLTLGIIF